MLSTQRSGRLVPVLLTLILFTAVFCPPLEAKKKQPSESAGPGAQYAEVLAAAGDYAAGRYDQCALRCDRFLAALAPADSQFAFLGLYYGLRSRLALGQSAAADSLFNVIKTRVPENQSTELLAVLGRLQAAAVPAQLAVNAPGHCNRIGVVLPLSGRYADFGQAIREGIQIAVDRYNTTHGETSRVEVVYRDDQSDPLIAATLGRELAKDSSVAGLIGSYQDDATLSLAMAASSSSLPVVCPTAESPQLAGLGPLVHAINRTDPAELRRLADFTIHKLGLQIFAVLAPDNEKGALLAASFRSAVRHNGGAVVADLRYSGEDNNFDSQMTLLQRYLPDAIYIPAELNDITQIASQVHYYGLGQARILGSETWRSERVLRMGGEYVEGVLFASSFYEGSRELLWNSFKADYERICQRPVNKYSALGFDAAGMLLYAAGNFPVSRKGLAEGLGKVSALDGAYGQYTVEPDGRVGRRTFILQISQGEVIPAQVPQVQESPAVADSVPPAETPAPGQSGMAGEGR